MGEGTRVRDTVHSPAGLLASWGQQGALSGGMGSQVIQSDQQHTPRLVIKHWDFNQMCCVFPFLLYLELGTFSDTGSVNLCCVSHSGNLMWKCTKPTVF